MRHRTCGRCSLPGDASLDGLTGLLLDLGVIVLRLQKPLTARLMPIPGKSAGDEIISTFHTSPTAGCLPCAKFPLGGLLAGAGLLDVGPRTYRLVVSGQWSVPWVGPVRPRTVAATISRQKPPATSGGTRSQAADQGLKRARHLPRRSPAPQLLRRRCGCEGGGMGSPRGRGKHFPSPSP